MGACTMLTAVGALLTSLIFLAVLRPDYAVNWKFSAARPTSARAHHAADDWMHIGTVGGIDSYVRKIAGSDLLAFRGVAYLDMHISQAMGPYINTSSSYEWVSMLKHIEQYPLNRSSKPKYDQKHDYEDLVYQVLDLPWPVSPRDVLLHRRFYFSPIDKTVSILYESVDDPRLPQKRGVIRAISPHSMWRFRSVPACAHEHPSSILRAATVGHGPVVHVHSPRSWLSKALSLVGGGRSPAALKIAFNFARSNPPPSTGRRVSLTQRGVSPQPSDRSTSRAAASSPQGIVRAVLQALRGLQATSGDSVEGAGSARTSGRLDDATCAPKQPTQYVGSEWSTQRSVEGKREGTVVEFESVVDSRGNIPTWFVNYMQRSFPAQALSAYRKLAETGRIAPYDRVRDW